MAPGYDGHVDCMLCCMSGLYMWYLAMMGMLIVWCGAGLGLYTWYLAMLTMLIVWYVAGLGLYMWHLAVLTMLIVWCVAGLGCTCGTRLC